MNLATWFKGLGVFALSSMITALATMQLDPASFNFSKAGLTKVGAAVLVIGVKSVLLYLKQSPLPGNQPARVTDWTKITSVLMLCVTIPVCALLAGCVSTWDQTTYESLAASKALIDCAVAGYNHFDADIRHACAASSQDGTQDAAFDPHVFYLPQTREAQQAVEKARQAHIAAVDAFAAYAVSKVAKDKSATLQQKQAAVVGLLEQIPALLNAVRGLMGKKPVGTAGRPNLRDPVAAIVALKPAAQGAETSDTKETTLSRPWMAAIPPNISPTLRDDQGRASTKYQILITKYRFSRGAILATNPVTTISSTDKLKQTLKTVMDAALFIEQILGEVGPVGGAGGFDIATMERVTAAFGNLAAITIQAAHDVAGKELTPENVMALMPVSTSLQPAV